MNIILGYVITYFYIILIVFSAEFLKKQFKISNEVARKFVHIAVCFYWLIEVYIFKNTFHILIPPISFAIINYVVMKKEKIKTFVRLDGNSMGVVYLPLSIFVLGLITLYIKDFYIYAGIGIFCLAFGDGLAPYFGKKFKSKELINNKTLSGTIALFIISCIVILIINHIYYLNLNIIKIILLSFLSAIIELLSFKGLDNIFLPISLSIIAYLVI